MNTDIPPGARAPYLWEAIISLFSLVVGISISIVAYGLDPQVPMLLGVVVSSIVAMRCGVSWQNIQDGMVRVPHEHGQLVGPGQSEAHQRRR